ncbi:hypothetical protein [Methylobacterium sp. Leaf100]|uniref:hypothetical protein n=1 Tax=Methylobacterium sp. Leaf100 TaxID=1736252 RepID=UPI000A6C183B|nr:hypothetical protein [Methylobacterium sp. Leaf100]
MTSVHHCMKPLPITADQIHRIIWDCDSERTWPGRDPAVSCTSACTGDLGTHDDLHVTLGHFAIIEGGISSKAWIVCEAAPDSIGAFFTLLDALPEDNEIAE